jgi:hypothetical protein
MALCSHLAPQRQYWPAPLIIALCLVPQPDPVEMPSEFVEGGNARDLIKRSERRKLWETRHGTRELDAKDGGQRQW